MEWCCRLLMDLLHPGLSEMYWGVSIVSFQRQVVMKAGFVSAPPPWLPKWVVRVRAGCLSAQVRLIRHKMENSAG